MSQNELNYFAIVGVGRSGTTLLMSMLNAHPSVAMPPEIQFITQHIVPRSKASLAEAVNRLKSDHRFLRLGLGIDEVTSAFHDEVEFSMAKLYIEILRAYLKKHPAAIIGDKAPKNIEYLPTIHRIIPTAKVIHIIRDPRDVYLSRKKAAWSSSRPDILHFLAYEAQIQLGRIEGDRLFNHHYLEIHYEKLLANPKEELHRICLLLGIEFSREMLNFSESARQIVSQEEMAWKKEALGPLLTDNSGKWREQLEPRSVLKIEAACPTVFEDGLYQYSEYHRSGGISKSLIRRTISLLVTLYKQYVFLRNRKATTSRTV